MAKIPPIDLLALMGRSSAIQYPLNNLTQILSHSRLSLDVYMQWNPLFNEVSSIVGKRSAYLYGFAISEITESFYYAVFFRNVIIDNGEDPDNLLLTETEQDLLSFGAEIAERNGHIEAVTFDALKRRFTNKELVILVAFAGQMIAANVFNNVFEIETDVF